MIVLAASSGDGLGGMIDLTASSVDGLGGMIDLTASSVDGLGGMIDLTVSPADDLGAMIDLSATFADVWSAKPRDTPHALARRRPAVAQTKDRGAVVENQRQRRRLLLYRLV